MTRITEERGRIAATIVIRPWVLLLIAVGGAFLIYGHLLGLSFFGDDFRSVWRAGLGADPGPIGFFRPLSDISIRLEHLLFGNAPQGYRAFNVLVHGLNIFVLVRLGQCLFDVPGKNGAALAPYLAGLLFLCYPFHNEAVLWIVGRGASMATLFTLLALWTLASGSADTWKQGITAICLFMGMLAYESVLLLPLLALPMLIVRKVGRRSQFRYAVIWGMAIVLHFALRLLVSGSAMNNYGSALFQHPWSSYAGNVPKVIGRLFLPPNADAHFQLIAFAILIVSLICAGARLWRLLKDRPDERRRVLELAWMVAVSALVAVIAGVSTRTSESDRFLYMPSAFLCLLMAVTICQLTHGFKRWSVMLILLAFSLFSLQRNNAHWALASRIICQTVAQVPEAPVGHHLFIYGVPSDTCGAFIFRNGFHEALLLAGKDTARMVLVEALEKNGTTGTRVRSYRGDTLAVTPEDLPYFWGEEPADKRP